MGRLLPRHVLAYAVAETDRVDAGEEVLTTAKQQRRDRDVQLVDQPGTQILPDGRNAAADHHVLAAGGLERARPCRLDAVGDEMKDRASRHVQWRTRMVRQHKDRAVE